MYSSVRRPLKLGAVLALDKLFFISEISPRFKNITDKSVFLSDLLKGLQPGAQHAATLSHSPLPAHLQQAYNGKRAASFLSVRCLYSYIGCTGNVF